MGRQPPRRKPPRERRLCFETLQRRELLSASALSWGETETSVAVAARGVVDEVLVDASDFQVTKTGPLAKVNSTLISVRSEFQSQSAGSPARNFAPTNPRVLVDDGTVLIDAVAAGDAATLQRDLIALGMQGASSFGSVVSGWLPLDSIDQMAALGSLQFSSAALQPWTNVGQVTSQGDRAQQSNDARRTFDVSGRGVKVGVLSDSFNTAAGSNYGQDRASGDLPAGIEVLADHANGNDEGRAMLQLIHDVAPGADLAFHTAFGGMADFANGIVDLADAGADVIVDDVIYFTEPMFQDGIVARAVDSVVARGVSYFSSAGNAGRDSYASPFVHSGQDLRVDGEQSGLLHDFDPGPGVDVEQRIRVPVGSGFVIAFQWDEPYFSVGGVGSRSDLDIYLVADGTAVAWSASANIGGDPVEILSFFNSGFSPSLSAGEFDLLIALDAGPAPSLMKTVRYDSGAGATFVEYDTASSTLYGHANAAGAAAVGAAFFRDTPEFGVRPARPEPFSSAGGTPILFNAAGSRVPSTVRDKPDFVAPDGANTTFFSSDTPRDADSFPNFFGTSAAAPHAAGVAALMLDRNPGLAPPQIYQILQQTAIDMEAAGFDFDTGYGLIDALAAVAAAVSDSDPPAITSTPVTAAVEDVSYHYEVSADDPNPGDVLTYRLDAAPAGMTINPTSGLIRWTPTNEQVGTHPVWVRVSDQHFASGTQSFTVTVANVNDPPRINSPPLTTATEDAPYVYTVAANDPDAGDALTYVLEIAPAGMTIDASSGLIEWTPRGDQLGAHAVSVRVTDLAGAWDTQDFTLSVAPAPEILVIGESGSLTVNQANGATWHSVPFARRYVEPVVVMGPLSLNGKHASTVRVRNVTSTGFQFQIDEWDYLDGAHAAETVGYLVVEAGTHTLTDGTRVVAGRTTAGRAWKSVDLPALDGKPVVLTQVTGVAAASAVTTRLRKVTATGFDVRVQEEESNDGKHAAEPVSYVAWATGVGSTNGLQFESRVTPDNVRHTPTTIALSQDFDAAPVLLAGLQTFGGADTSALRYTSLSADAASIFIEEEQSRDTERDHTTEAVGYLTLESGPIHALAALPHTTPGSTSGAVGESGVVTVSQASATAWHSVSFARSYVEPVVVMGPVSFNGTHPSTVRVRNVTSDGFQFQIDEWDYLDGAHAAESIGYLVVEAGTHLIGDDTRLVAGTTTANQVWRTVTLDGLTGTPVVLAQVTGVNESAAVTTRLRNVSAATFQVRLQEEQASDGRHAAEPVSYIAIETAVAETAGTRFEAKRTSDGLNHAATEVPFSQTFRTSPVLLANIQSFAGGDPSVLRYTSLSTPGASVFVEEERSADAETDHMPEIVGYLALEPGLIDLPPAPADASGISVASALGTGGVASFPAVITGPPGVRQANAVPPPTARAPGVINEPMMTVQRRSDSHARSQPQRNSRANSQFQPTDDWLVLRDAEILEWLSAFRRRAARR